MANHKSALKALRSSEKKRLRNRYQLKTCRTFIKKLRNTTDKQEAGNIFKTVTSMLDKLARKKLIHRNKSARNKAKLASFVHTLR